MIYRTSPFSITLNDPYPRFQGHTIFDAEYLRNGTIYRHSFYGILIGTYTRPTQRFRFEWPRVTLSHLAKYSVTRSVARSLCNSWASCVFLQNDYAVVGQRCHCCCLFLILVFRPRKLHFMSENILKNHFALYFSLSHKLCDVCTAVSEENTTNRLIVFRLV